MRRSLYCAQHRMNPETTVKSKYNSGDTLDEPTWGTPYEEKRMGSVQEGISFTDPLNSDQPKYSRKKVYK